MGFEDCQTASLYIFLEARDCICSLKASLMLTLLARGQGSIWVLHQRHQVFSTCLVVNNQESNSLSELLVTDDVLPLDRTALQLHDAWSRALLE